MAFLKSNDCVLTRPLYLLWVPPESDLDTGFHYSEDKWRRHQQGTGKGNKKSRLLIKGTLARRVPTGQLGLNPWGKLNTGLGAPAPEGDGSRTPQFCQFGVRSHNGGGRRCSFSGASSLL